MTDYRIHSIEFDDGAIRLRLQVGKQARLASIELTNRQALVVASELNLAALKELDMTERQAQDETTDGAA